MYELIITCNSLERIKSEHLFHKINSRWIMPLVQAPYLLKCVPDRVANDSSSE